jgi:hypothetical protein
VSAPEGQGDAVVSVHVASAADGVMDGRAPAKRKRRKLVTNTFTLTAANPTQRVFTRSANRVEGYLTSATEASPPVIYMGTSQADANSQGGGAAQVSGSDTGPVPVNTTDEVWISAATGYPVTVGVWAIYETNESD